MRLKRSLIVGVATAALVLTGCATDGGGNTTTPGVPDGSDLPAGVSLDENGG